MRKSLEEYAERNQRPEPEQERRTMEETARTYTERRQELEAVEELKTSIMQQLEQGNAPELILLTAIRAIGILTHDEQWTNRGRQIIESVYNDLAQQSLLTDNAAIAAQRLERMQSDYNDKMRKRIQQSFRGYRKLEKALNEAWNALKEMGDKNP